VCLNLLDIFVKYSEQESVEDVFIGFTILPIDGSVKRKIELLRLWLLFLGLLIFVFISWFGYLVLLFENKLFEILLDLFAHFFFGDLLNDNILLFLLFISVISIVLIAVSSTLLLATFSIWDTSLVFVGVFLLVSLLLVAIITVVITSIVAIISVIVVSATSAVVFPGSILRLSLGFIFVSNFFSDLGNFLWSLLILLDTDCPAGFEILEHVSHDHLNSVGDPNEVYRSQINRLDLGNALVVICLGFESLQDLFVSESLALAFLAPLIQSFLGVLVECHILSFSQNLFLTGIIFDEDSVDFGNGSIIFSDDFLEFGHDDFEIIFGGWVLLSLLFAAFLEIKTDLIHEDDGAFNCEVTYLIGKLSKNTI